MVTLKPTPLQEAKAVTRRKAADFWGVSEGLVIKLDRLGLIKTISIGRAKRVPLEEVHRVLREGVPSETVNEREDQGQATG